MQKKPKKKAFAKKARDVIKRVIGLCGRCLQNKRRKGNHEIAPIMKTMKPREIGEERHIDLFGPFKKDPKDTTIQKGFVIGAVDSFSKYMVEKMIPNKSAHECLKFFTNEICLKFGVPKILSSDQLSEFDNESFAMITTMYGVKRIQTSRYSPRSNAEIERRWSMLKSTLRRNTLTYNVH